jgi:molybdopterin/thiamine biosynthesis adenylyltransferase
MTAGGDGEQLSADEIALYDRQLRLWGIEAQNRMRKAHILLINVKALGNEIAKNLVLAGIGSLTVLDTDVVTEQDVATQFFVTEEDIGKNVGLILIVLTWDIACRSFRGGNSTTESTSQRELQFHLDHLSRTSILQVF